jgi:hypothetical protein
MKHGTEKWILSAVAYLQMPLARAQAKTLIYNNITKNNTYSLHP